MGKRHFFLLLALAALSLLLASVAWEFVLEDFMLGALRGGQYVPEDVAYHWEHIITITMLAWLALLPVALLCRALIGLRVPADSALEKLTMAGELSPNPVLVTDANGKIEYINEKFTALTGYAPEQLIGQTPRVLQSGETPDEVYHELWATITAGNEWRGEVLNRKRGGDPYRVRETIKPVRDASGRIAHFVATQEDITAARRDEQRLAHEATHDALTELANRREFARRLDRVLDTQRGEGSQHALAYLDLDHFKAVNDACGHEAGDEALRRLAALMRSQVRQRDTLARLGGDEFGLLMEHCTLAAARRSLQALADALGSSRFEWRGRVFEIHASIGLVPVDGSCVERDALMRRADAACYAAKHAGGNRIHVTITGEGDLPGAFD